MAAGDFSPSVLQDIMLRAEQVWSGGVKASQYQANAIAAKAVLDNQTARITALEDPEKDNTVRVTWIDTCSTAVEDCESNCELDEPEAESKAKDYELTLCKKTGFSVDAEKVRTNIYTVQDISAENMAAKLKAMDEWLAQQTLVKLKSFAGINVFPDPWTYDAVANTTDVPAADYNRKMVASLLQQQIMNKMQGAYYIDNGSLWLDWTNAQLDAGNLDGKGDASRIAALNMYFDQFNFAPAGLTEDTFMVAPGAVAIANKVRYTPTPTLIGGKIQQTRWTVDSPTLPGIKYDVYYALTCKTVNGKEHIMHTWRIEFNGDILLNPNACPVTIGGTTYSPTGVISYTKEAA